MEDSASLASVPTRLTLSTSTVDVETKPDRVIVRLGGELDMADADQVGDVLTDAVKSGTSTVRVDLSALRFADSSAIKAILIGAQMADDRGVAFELFNPYGPVQRLLEVTGLEQALMVLHEPETPGGSN